MRHRKQPAGPGVTRAGDLRVTAVGRWLRQCKLDELPQLFNLLAGHMSLVGPRPDLADFFAELPPAELAILQLRPGITGCATLHFRHEEELLARVPAPELREFYVRQVLPVKIRLDLEYASRASFLADLRVLSATLSAIVR
jgi:lipopolysaccharide/colanic/teichoic acid biosynthesis glycosyltransferase